MRITARARRVPTPGPARGGHERSDKDMASSKTSTVTVAAVKDLLSKPAELDEFLAKLAARDRQNVDRHLIAADAEAEPEHAKLWRRIARALFTLSPHAVTTIGQQALQFFIADGKYKKQV